MAYIRGLICKSTSSAGQAALDFAKARKIKFIEHRGQELQEADALLILNIKEQSTEYRPSEFDVPCRAITLGELGSIDEARLFIADIPSGSCLGILGPSKAPIPGMYQLTFDLLEAIFRVEGRRGH